MKDWTVTEMTAMDKGRMDVNAYLTRNKGCGKSVLLNVDLYYLTQCLAHHRLSVLVVGILNWDFHMEDRTFLATLAYSPTPSSLASQNIKDFCLFSLGFTSYQHNILSLFAARIVWLYDSVQSIYFTRKRQPLQQVVLGKLVNHV